MKRLSDYKGEEALELWADIFDPLYAILTAEEVKKAQTDTSSKRVQKIASAMIKVGRKELYSILIRIDEEEIDGANFMTRLMSFIVEIMTGKETRAFFQSSEQEKEQEKSSGSVTENTGDGEN